MGRSRRARRRQSDRRSRRPAGLRADDGERNVLAHRECQQGFDVLGGDVDIPDLGLECGSGVAGRHPHFAHARGLRAFPGEGVFAAACTDDQIFMRVG